jgi:hypothetical protein
MPYIARDTSVIYAAADTAAVALAEAEKDLRARLPTEDIDEALKSLEVHEATSALVNDSNSWVKWAYLKNGVACAPWRQVGNSRGNGAPHHEKSIWPATPGAPLRHAVPMSRGRAPDPIGTPVTAIPSPSIVLR